MALIVSLGAFGVSAIFGIAFLAVGARLLRWSGVSGRDSVEGLLLSIAAGAILFEIAAALISYTNRFRSGIAVLTGLLAVVAIPEVPSSVRGMFAVARRHEFSNLEKILAGTAFVALLIEGLSAMAPLTGSDALHYHFTTVRLYLENGFHPVFSIVHSFLIGQNHELIVAGLALGSEKLAMGLLYLGGVLTAAVAATLAYRLSSTALGLVTALAFLLTPIVFWQITESGTPDVWMAFFTTTAVLCVARYSEQPSNGLSFWIGMLCGSIAGAKYSGCIIAASIVLAFLWEARSWRPQPLLLSGMLCAGCWPYIRNFVWTHDPFFPFGMRWFAPNQVNAFTLASLVADTGTSPHLSPLKLLLFATFSHFDAARPGFFQFFGPLCLLLVPLLLVSIKNKSLWRAILIVWIVSTFGVGGSSDRVRFVLPLFPVALAASIAAISSVKGIGAKVVRVLATATIVIVLVAGFAGLVIYERLALAASLGRIGAGEYLREQAPDYEQAEFVNEHLDPNSGSKALVFFQHLYYLRVPFIYGDPKASWMINPEKLKSREQWLGFFKGENIRWVVRSPNYPDSVATPLRELEKCGDLQPFATGETSDLVGKRMQGVKVSLPIVILQVREPDP